MFADLIVRIAAVGDLHCGRGSLGTLQPLFARIGESADVLLLAGDLTDRGLADEAHMLARELSTVRIPIVAVLGNHDFESDQQDLVREIVAGAGVTVLDGGSCEVRRIGVAGVKGFAGGFGQRALGAWGEPAIKQFVHEALNESLKLETALARLRTAHTIALMHYSPVQQTVAGEPPEVYPFAGSSRLEEPLGRFPVTAVVHAHAHHGTPTGETARGVPVYNVSLPLLMRVAPEQPFRIIEIAVTPPAGTAEADAHGHE
jgi:Icc-related predicted phosphoesterase